MRWLKQIPHLIIALVYVGIGLHLIAVLMWGTTAIGVCLLAMAYVRLELIRLRVTRPGDWDSESEIIHDAAVKVFRRAGFAILVAMALMFAAWVAGEGWGWLIPATVGSWLAIVVVFRKQLGPRDMPARWFP